MASSDPDDRSSDLSIISSNMLEGIQVFKTVTADMDANVIGGTVNFELREAEGTESGSPKYGLQLQEGYNNLSNAYDKFRNYKAIASVEDRFMDDRLGVFAQVDLERKNLTSNEMGASYTHAGNSLTDYYTTGLSLYNIPRDISRNNGAVIIDYRLPEGKIKLSNFISYGTSDNLTRQETFGVSSNTHSYALSNSASNSTTVTNGIDFQHQIPIFNMRAKLSHSYSESETPKNWYVSFDQTSAGLTEFSNVEDINPVDIPPAANNDYSITKLGVASRNSSFSKEQAINASVDFTTNMNFSKQFSAEIKFGGMYRYQTKYYDYDQYDGGGFSYGGAGFANDLILDHFSIPKVLKYNIPIDYFADESYDYGEMFDGDYTMNKPLDEALLKEMVDMLYNNVDTILAVNGSSAFGHNNFASTTYDYSGYEKQSAFYLMSVIDIGPNLTITPGIRYQNLETRYKGIRGVQARNSFDAYNYYDTTTTTQNGYWLPSALLRYKPFSWFDIRLSYTNTLAYPDYNAIIPRTDVGNGTIYWNNYNLTPSRSTNYDVNISFYDNTIGLFTIGGFLKQIDDLIYPWSSYVKNEETLDYYPAGLLTSTPTGIYKLTTYVNNPFSINNYGMELEWQTHFWYLPGPLSGLVLSANYTHIFSEAEYPYVEVVSTGRSVTYIDTSFTDRLLTQPDDIFNISLGFDYKDFSIRASLLYQADIFTGINFWPQLRTHTSAYQRWDFAAKQKLPWLNIELYGNINNLNNAKDESVIQGGGVPQSLQDYGMTANLGVRLKL